MLVDVLDLLTDLATRNKMLYIDRQLRPPDTRLQCRDCLTYTKMTMICRIVKFLQQKLMKATSLWYVQLKLVR